MSRITTKLLVSAAALAAITAGTASAANCALDVRHSGDGSGFLTASAAADRPGHWEMTAYQITPTGYLDMSQSGQVRPSRYMSTLSRNYLTTMYRGPARYGPEAPHGVRPQDERLNEGAYGVDVSVAAELRVYDNVGRLVCQDGINQQAMPATPQRGRAYLPLNTQRLNFSRFNY